MYIIYIIHIYIYIYPHTRVSSFTGLISVAWVGLHIYIYIYVKFNTYNFLQGFHQIRKINLGK